MFLAALTPTISIFTVSRPSQPSFQGIKTRKMTRHSYKRYEVWQGKNEEQSRISFWLPHGEHHGDYTGRNSEDKLFYWRWGANSFWRFIVLTRFDLFPVIASRGLHARIPVRLVASGAVHRRHLNRYSGLTVMWLIISGRQYKLTPRSYLG